MNLASPSRLALGITFLSSLSTLPLFAQAAATQAAQPVSAEAASADSATKATQSQPQKLEDVVVSSTTTVEKATGPVQGIVAKQTLTATKTDTPIINIPESISIISQDEIELRSAINLNQAVGYTAGVFAEPGGRDSRGDDLMIRGFSSSSTSKSIYLDGMRSPQSSSWTYPQYDTFGVERVEVLKGPSSVLYGQVAPGGLVNMVSKRPTGENSGSVGVRFASHQTVEGTFDFNAVSPNSDAVQFRLVGLVRDGNAEVDHTELKRTFLAPSLTFNISEDTSLTLLTQYQQDTGGATFQFLPAIGTITDGAEGKIDSSTFIGEPDWNLYDRTQYSAGYAFEHVFNDHFTLRQNARYSHVETEYKSVVAGRGAVNADGRTVRRRLMHGFGDADSFTLDTHLQSKFETGDIAHTILTGVDYMHTSYQNTTLTAEPGANPNFLAIDIYDPVYVGLPGLSAALAALAARGSVDATEWQAGIYAQEQAQWGNLHATLGVRYDWTDLDSLNRLTSVRTEQDPGRFTWRTGLLYHFDNGLAPYLSYSTSFDPVSGTSSPANGSKPFDPTKGEQYEIGLKYKPANFDALFTASLFEINQSNLLTRDPADPTYNVQVGKTRVRGLELESRVNLFKGLTAITGISWMTSEITRSNNGEQGNKFASVPNCIASGWLDYTLPDEFLPGLSFGAGVRYIGARYADTGNTIHLPDYTLFDAAIRYDLGKQFPSLQGARVALSATNLADKTYVATAGTGGGGVAYYGSGRNVSLSFHYDW